MPYAHTLIEVWGDPVCTYPDICQHIINVYKNFLAFSKIRRIKTGIITPIRVLSRPAILQED